MVDCRRRYVPKWVTPLEPQQERAAKLVMDRVKRELQEVGILKEEPKKKELTPVKKVVVPDRGVLLEKAFSLLKFQRQVVWSFKRAQMVKGKKG